MPATKPAKLFRSAFSFIIFWLFACHCFGQETTKILLEQADRWEFNKAIAPDIQRILGHVVMRHDSTWLYCDSAYLNEGKNNVIAYGNVHIKVSDTLNIFGDTLKYNAPLRKCEELSVTKNWQGDAACAPSM